MAAWNQLCRVAYPPILSQLTRLTGDADSAKDLAQETFLRLIRNQGRALRAYDAGRAPFPTYLRTIASRLFYTWIASAPVRRSRDSLELSTLEEILDPERNSASSSSPDDSVLTRDLMERIERLPGKLRTAMSLIAHGASYKEISGVMGITVGAVGAYVSRARSRLIDQDRTRKWRRP